MTALPASPNCYRRPRGVQVLIVALLASLCALALPTAQAFGEGSVDFNAGPGTANRHGLMADNSGNGTGYTVLRVYARAGETLQMASSAMQVPGGVGNILLYPRGMSFDSNFVDTTDLATFPPAGSAIFNCNTQDPGTGRIGSRAQELAGPLPNAGGYNPCEFTVPAGGDGIYSIIMLSPSNVFTPYAGSVNVPTLGTDQGTLTSMWDVTVRDTGGAVHDGRVFTNTLYTGSFQNFAGSDVNAFLYTKTGYEYAVEFQAQAGAVWRMGADDRGVVNVSTGDPLYASFNYLTNIPAPGLPANAPLTTAGDSWLDTRHPIFFNRPSAGDMLAITGPGGLGEVRGFSATPIAPGTNPFSVAFTGAGGQSGVTNKATGGSVAFTSPRAMEGLRYRLLLDLNNDGTFGNGADVTTSGDLNSSGNSFAWDGRDAAGNSPPCGTYPYRVQAALSEVHLTESDAETSGGTTLERLTLPNDPALPGPFLLSYNDIDAFTGAPVTNASPLTATQGDSSVPGFHAYTAIDTSWIDTWARLPEVQGTGTFQVLCPDVEIVKSSTAPLVAGEDGTYELTVTNHGPGPAVNEVATDDLPSGLSFVSASNGCSEAAKKVTCTAGTLAVDESKTFTIRVKVKASVKDCGDVRNTAKVTGDYEDPEPINNTSTICNLERRADLSLSKEASSATVTAGGQVMYTMVVKNNGPSDDDNVKVKDPVPAGLTLVSAKPAQGSCSKANNALSCDLGTLAAGGSTQILVTAQLSGTECVTNTARVGGDSFDPNLKNNTDDAKVCPVSPPDPRFDLVVKKTANHKRISGDGTVRYTIKVTNKGPDAAPAVKFTDTFNRRATVKSVKTTAGTCGKALPIRCSLGTIAAGRTVTITVVLQPRVSGCHQRNAASATGDGTDTNPKNNLDKVDICVSPKLRIVKTADRTSVAAGGLLHYTIRVTNVAKKVTAMDVRTCDTLPAGLVFVSSKPKAKLSKGSYCWKPVTIKPGKKVSYRLTVRALSAADGRKRNVATADTPGGGPISDPAVVEVLGQQRPTPQPTG